MTKSAGTDKILDMKKFLGLVLICVLCVSTAYLALACKRSEPSDGDIAETVCEHDFVAAESELNRPATHTSEGRQYVVCSKCGFSKLEIIPKLGYESGDKAPEFNPLLDAYEGVPARTTFKQFTEKYLPSGWAFKNEDAGAAIADGEYLLVFTPTTEGYTPFESTVTIKTRSPE